MLRCCLAVNIYTPVDSAQYTLQYISVAFALEFSARVSCEQIAYLSVKTILFDTPYLLKS